MEFLSYEYLKLAWWILIGVLWICFALTEGFDMGVAMILPFVGKTDEERRVAINAIAPHWDGNQVWLILAAGALFAAWPTLYATAFSAMYLALLILLFSLFLRPVGFDYRSKLPSQKWRNFWDWALFVPGVIPPLIFGVGMGNLFLGIGFEYDDLMRSSLDTGFLQLLHPFALLSGLLAIAMFMMHGASYLMLRSAWPVYDRARSFLGMAALAVIVLFAIEGIWLWQWIDGYAISGYFDITAVSNPLNKTVTVGEVSWLHNYTVYPWFIIAPVLGFGGALLAFIMGKAEKPVLAFYGSCLSLIGIILTAGFSLFPFIFPSSLNPDHSLTMWDATSSALTLNIMFWASLFFVPLILAYTSWCYKVMWGKHTVESIRENEHTLY
ncbi:MAG: cytochrome d ubiquinol oxidase subunit II [Gammaproteobacteria bacterium]|nr:cytochrome d ubiquinol oxidase subunit II [Gammaproteobacteria bacterium]